MPSTEIFVLLSIALAVWFWVDTLKARETGIAAVRAACNNAGLQLLDDTVATASVRLGRTDRGHVAIRRVYQFEYSDTGNNRRNGSVTLLGSRVVMMSISPELVELV
ncbi:MAG: DUF3301 domain-containing protein [Rhodocyclaceae bacterium]|nr:DUF3301 domain-containing protein [Rhodocyclaceae bacterium]